MFCAKCKTRNEKVSKYCSNCGNRLTHASETASSYITRNKLFLLVMLVVVLFVVAIVVFNVINNPEAVRNNSLTSGIDAGETSSSDHSSSQNDSKDDLKEGAAVLGYEDIRLGQEISTDFVDFTIKSSDWSFDLLPSDTLNGGYSYYKGTDGEMFYFLKGTIKNTHGQQYDIDNMEIEMIFNDRYTYRGRVAAESADKKGFYGDMMNPLQETTFYLYTNVPDELFNKFETCETRIAFEDEFEGIGYEVSVEEIEYKYRIINEVEEVELIENGEEYSGGEEKETQIRAEEDYIYWVDSYLDSIAHYLKGIDTAMMPGVRKDSAWEELIEFGTNKIIENCEAILSLEVPNKYEGSSKYLSQYCQELIKGMNYYSEHNFSQGDNHINEAKIQLSTYHVMRN